MSTFSVPLWVFVNNTAVVRLVIICCSACAVVGLPVRMPSGVYVCMAQCTAGEGVLTWASVTVLPRTELWSGLIWLADLWRRGYGVWAGPTLASWAPGAGICTYEHMSDELRSVLYWGVFVWVCVREREEECVPGTTLCLRPAQDSNPEICTGLLFLTTWAGVELGSRVACRFTVFVGGLFLTQRTEGK